MSGFEELHNIVRREVHRVMAKRAKPRYGLVTAYDPDTYAVKVMLQPEEIETEWIPISAEHIGNGFGMVYGPEINDQVKIGFQEDDPSSPIVVGRVHSDDDKPPKAEAGEMVMRRKDGSQVKMDKNGTVRINSAGLLKLNMGE